MKEGIKEIIGKTIESVVVTSNHLKSPGKRLHLNFTNGTSLEIYGPDFTCCSGTTKDTIERQLNMAKGFDHEVKLVWPERRK